MLTLDIAHKKQLHIRNKRLLKEVTDVYNPGKANLLTSRSNKKYFKKSDPGLVI